MNAEHDLLQAYREWHRLALAEASAIQTRDWDFLAACQSAIQVIQTNIHQLLAQVRQEWQLAGCDLAEKEQQLQICVHQLIQTTQQNQTLLVAAKTIVLERLDQLGEAGRNLKRLRGSYGGLDSAWSTSA
jgi:hypothetical protein